MVVEIILLISQAFPFKRNCPFPVSLVSVTHQFWNHYSNIFFCVQLGLFICVGYNAGHSVDKGIHKSQSLEDLHVKRKRLSPVSMTSMLCQIYACWICRYRGHSVEGEKGGTAGAAYELGGMLPQILLTNHGCLLSIYPWMHYLLPHSLGIQTMLPISQNIYWLSNRKDSYEP